MATIYKDLIKTGDGSTDFVTTSDTISSGMWAGGAGTITSFFTSSAQSASNGQYYLDVYAANPQSDSTAQPQFSIAYGHFHGSGSKGLKGTAGDRASKTIYSQVANLVLAAGTDRFTFANQVAGKKNSIYVMSVARQQLREKMDPGNWELHISGGYDEPQASVLKLIDDSSTVSQETGLGGRVFNIVSGSLDGGTTIKTAAASQTNGGLGLFYPDLGLLVFNGHSLNLAASLGEATGSNSLGDNNTNFFNAISSGSKFQARREEIIDSQHYFCRVPNADFNYSSNPTFSLTGSFTQQTFIKNPRTFITQVGLYNEANELLAVAKLSKPLLKSFSREAIIKVKLDF
tara:strand:- start:1088 stop:2122 length:1035 start_codon:yes stop_codon:yes gene_type:complete